MYLQRPSVNQRNNLYIFWRCVTCLPQMLFWYWNNFNSSNDIASDFLTSEFCYLYSLNQIICMLLWKYVCVSSIFLNGFTCCYSRSLLNQLKRMTWYLSHNLLTLKILLHIFLVEKEHLCKHTSLNLYFHPMKTVKKRLPSQN